MRSGRIIRRPSGWFSIAAIASLGLWLACSHAESPTEEKPQSGQSFISLIPLTNAEFQIVEMATAHGALTLEVEVSAEADTRGIARRLVEPIRERYAEILVYFYDRDSNDDLPMLRVQWTPDDGYSEITYDTP